MSIFNSIWSGLKIGYDKVYSDRMAEALSTLHFRYTKSHDGVLVYKSHAAYKSVFEFIARQTALQYAERTINGLWPKYQKKIEQEIRKTVLAQQDRNRVELISMGQKIDSGLGVVQATDGQYTYIAQDKYGAKVPDALMVYYDADTPVLVTDKVKEATMLREGIDADPEDYMGGSSTSASTKTVCFIDLAPEVSISSSKNVILTNVQGRDYSRKELVSGGDLKFSVAGNIVFDEPDVYPDNDVKKFIQIMQYNGVIKVNHRLFRQFGINSIIVQDFSLGKPEFKNMQPYSFQCVAVEPDDEVVITTDTIGTINHDIAVSPLDGWYKLVLDKKSMMGKLVQQGAQMAAETTLTSIGALNDLVPNI